MFLFNRSHIINDLNYYFGKQWHFKRCSPARTDDLEELVPTFDSEDRVSNSWRCLYLFAGKKWAGTDGIYAAGGYQLAFAVRGRGLAAFPRELEELILAPSMCTHKPEEIFQYREEDSKTIWKCQVDQNLSFITILGLNAESGNMLEGSLKIPDIIDSLLVEKMDFHTFDKENHIQEITLPDRLYKEGLSGSVFNNCQDLKNIWISPKISTIFHRTGCSTAWAKPRKF